MDKPLYHFEGMHGLGDNLHQRAVLRALMQRYTVWLDTSWPCIYHDLVPQGLRLVHRPVALRTQLKNAMRESERQKFLRPPLGTRGPKMHMIYQRATVGNGTILKAMFKCAGIPHEYENFDFSLPVLAAWHEQLSHVFDPDGVTKPLMIYRPLTVRPEWRGGAQRNANAQNYAEILHAIRDSFFVVSVADLEPEREWTIGPQLRADATFHKGELTFEMLAALVQRADLLYTSSGMGAILAPSVGTPCISVQGGYHPSSWHADGAKHAPWLGIDPTRTCDCASSSCVSPCAKNIDVPDAVAKVKAFLAEHCGISTLAEPRPFSEMFEVPPPAPARPRGPPPQIQPRITQSQLLARRQAQRGIRA